ncbi:MAG: hypothetical protein AAGJ79_11260 [Verrucomicrobiota bacterium]
MAMLDFMKPEVWYCFGEFDGCVEISRDTPNVNGKALTFLAQKGFVESVPVFEGFMTLKYRITPEGIACLETR